MLQLIKTEFGGKFVKMTYPAFLKKQIDLAPLGVEQRTDAYPYFCTPKGAKIFGWAGVDGIHFCFIRGFGEMVFAVSPMNTSPNFVHPLSYTFDDFLRLLLACGDSAPLEQAWQWDKAQFSAFLADNLPTEESKTVLKQIGAQTGLTPMEQPWEYLKDVQAAFDYSKVKYTEDYYDPDMNPDAPQKDPEWKVTFDCSFFHHRRGSRAGREISICRTFPWAERTWYIPALYICGKGLVVDFCMRADPSALLAFQEKWNLRIESEAHRSFTREERMQMEAENPLQFSFRPTLHLNGKDLRMKRGCGTSYNPCVPEGYMLECEGAWAAKHYQLDPNYGWMIWRFCFPYVTKRRPDIRTLSLTLSQEAVARPGKHFQVRSPGDTVVFSYGGKEYCLTLQEYAPQVMDWSKMPRKNAVYPSHYMAMTYTLSPELPDGVLEVSDCVESDQPKREPPAPGQPVATSDVAVIGIIRGADGPTSMILGQKRPGKLHAACSALHFSPAKSVEWRMVFHETQFADFTVDLLP